MKKLVAIIICLMILSSVVGCQKNDNTNNVNKENVEDNKKENANDDKNNEKANIDLPKEKMKISIGSAGFTSADDDLARFFEEKFNIEIIAMDTQGDKLNLLATALNLPDVFVGSIKKTSIVNNWIQQEMIREIPPSFFAEYEDIKARFDDSVIGQAYYRENSNYYFYPIRFGGGMINPHSQYIRQDWLDVLDLDMPESYDELYEVAKAFTLEDPDQNGKDDTYGIGGKMFTPHYINFIGANRTSWIYENGQFIPSYLSENMLDALKWWHTIIQDGYIDPEFPVTSGDKLIDQFCTGKIGFMVRQADRYWGPEIINKRFRAANPEIENPWETVNLVPPLKANIFEETIWDIDVEPYGAFFSEDVSDEKLAKIFEIINFILSEEGGMLGEYGFEGIDYTIDENDKLIDLKPDLSISDIYPSQPMLKMGAYNTINDYKEYTKEEDELEEKRLNLYLEPSKRSYFNPFIDFMSTPAKDMVGYDPETDLMSIAAVNGTLEDVEDAFDAWRDKVLKSKRVQKVIDEVNKKANEEGIKP